MSRPDRQIVELLSTAVPCALSKNGTHMLTIGMTGAKELVYLNAPCEAIENKKGCQSAHMLEAITCSTMVSIIRGGFRRDLLTAKDIRAYLDSFSAFMIYPLFRKSMFEIFLVANRVGASRLGTPVPLRGHPGPIELRTADIITSWLQRHLPAQFHDQFAVRWPTGRRSPAGLFHAYGSAQPISAWRLAELEDDKFILNSDEIRRSFREQIGISEDGTCVYCGGRPTRPARHSNSTKHRTAVIAAIRCAVRLLNNPKILRLVNKAEK